MGSLDVREGGNVAERPPRSEHARLPARLSGERCLWERFAAHREAAVREELARRYLPFSERLAGRYRNAEEPFDDLLQVARLGLLNAIDRFDPARGIPFPAFATPTIRGELRRHFRDRAWTIRVPRGLHDLTADVDKAIDELTRELQRSPSIGEIAARLEVDAERVLEVLQSAEARRPLSLDRPLGTDEEAAPASERIGSEDDGFELSEDRLALRAAMSELGEGDRALLRLRFVEEMTQAQIAERLGCSQMQVSRVLRAVLGRIREKAEATTAA